LGMLSSTWAINKKYQEGYELVSSTINSAARETYLSLFKNNQLVLLKPDPKSKNKKMKVYTSTIKENGELSKPKESKELSKLALEGTIAYDDVAKKIYFTKYNGLSKNYDLYETAFKKGRWTEPKPMTIEGTGSDREEESFIMNAGWSYRELGLSGFKNPSLAKNGKRIYFTASFKGGSGGTDIWYIDQKEDGTWGAPQNAGKNINTVGREDYAFSVGDTILVFSTTAGKSGVDLMSADLNEGEWQKAQNMGAPFNSALNDQNLVATKDNVYLLSARNPRMREDIYHFKKLPPKPVIPQAVVIPPPPPPPPTKKEEALKWNYTLFYFDFDKDVLTDEFVAQFKELVGEMKEFPGATFEVAGHTDSKGSDAYNDKLSIKRAEFVKALLIKEGFPADKIVTKGYGERQPVIPDAKTEDEFMQNRRCEIRIINQQ
jgi:outer membrane protein OmpA-like peptidoglycan-associated protein